MNETDVKLARSLSAQTTEIISYLPYLLQDLSKLGSEPEDIEDILLRVTTSKTKILDLACGKGAVAVHLAKAFGCHIKGIDIIREFIEYARNMAVEYGVEKLCDFIEGDINELIDEQNGYDIVIISDVSEILGHTVDTILKLKSTINPKGYILLDDAYSLKKENTEYMTKQEILDIYDKTGVKLVTEKIGDADKFKKENQFNYMCIQKRAYELIEKYPGKRGLFEEYLKSQQEESIELENELICVSLLLQVN